MKGAGGALPGKRRWKGLVIAVLGLVFLSMLVPLFLLLGQNNGFHSSPGYDGKQRTPTSSHVRIYDQPAAVDARNNSKVHRSTHMEDLIRRFSPAVPKGFVNKPVMEVGYSTSAGSPKATELPKQDAKANITGSLVRHNAGENILSADETDVFCEIKFGSYCLWRREHREKMEDNVVKRMKDLLFVARAYYPSVAKLPTLEKLSHELKQNIQDFERVLSETTTDKDLPPQSEKKLIKMETVIAKAKSCPVDCNNVDKKLRQLVDLTEDEANFHTRQSAFLFRLSVLTMPKSLHCLSMRLTVEYFRSSVVIEKTILEKFVDPHLFHYVIFSKNILASSVVINSTVLHVKVSEKHIFHVLTDRENYFSMKLWFSRNKYGDSAVEVLNIEDLKLYDHHMVEIFPLLLPEEYRVSFRRVDNQSSPRIKTEYLSMFSHSHYLLPKIFRTLEKVVVLDDDIVVQKDLSFLWKLDMAGKVNGAIQFCAVKFFHLKNYFSGNVIDENSCVWTSGVNVIDLSGWRRRNLSETYLNLVHEMRLDNEFSDVATLSASLQTFQGLVYALEGSWMLSGLGHNHGMDLQTLKTAGILHFDGSMKPWLELGSPKYRSLWRKFLSQQNQFLNDCNVNQ